MRACVPCAVLPVIVVDLWWGENGSRLLLPLGLGLALGGEVGDDARRCGGGEAGGGGM